MLSSEHFEEFSPLRVLFLCFFPWSAFFYAFPLECFFYAFSLWEFHENIVTLPTENITS